MPPRTINLSITHELIAKTFSSNLLSACERVEDKAREESVRMSAPGRPEMGPGTRLSLLSQA